MAKLGQRQKTQKEEYEPTSRNDDELVIYLEDKLVISLDNELFCFSFFTYQSFLFEVNIP